MKNKTLAASLAFFGGPLGLHRFYLFGLSDSIGWLLPIPTALGVWGFERVAEYGIDDVLSWWLISLPFFSVQGPGVAIGQTLNLLIISGIFYLRARTEENHLSNYPK